MKYLRVSNMLSVDGCFWNRPSDCELIWRIPVSLSHPPNKIIWHFALDERYSVKSGYRLVMNLYLNMNVLIRDGPWQQI